MSNGNESPNQNAIYYCVLALIVVLLIGAASVFKPADGLTTREAYQRDYSKYLFENEGYSSEKAGELANVVSEFERQNSKK